MGQSRDGVEDKYQPAGNLYNYSRPIKIIRDLIADKRTVETRGNTLG